MAHAYRIRTIGELPSSQCEGALELGDEPRVPEVSQRAGALGVGAMRGRGAGTQSASQRSTAVRTRDARALGGMLMASVDDSKSAMRRTKPRSRTRATRDAARTTAQAGHCSFADQRGLVAHARGAGVEPVARAVAELPRAYADATGTAVPEGEFAWYMAAHLVGRQLRTCIRHWVPGVAAVEPVLFGWAEAALASGTFGADVIRDGSASPASYSVLGPMSE